LATAPELLEHSQAVLLVVAEEIRLRQQAGLPLSAEDFCNRFPRWQDEVRTLLAQAMDRGPPPSLRFPPCGEMLAGCLLLAELGQGVHGRVYLGVQPQLGDRPVVLKVAPADGE